MDSSFALNLTASIAAFLYLATLLIQVNFRGDFGMLSETPLSARHSHSSHSGWNEMFEIPMSDIRVLLSRQGSMGIVAHPESKTV